MPVRKSFWDYFPMVNFVLRAVGILPIGGPSSLWRTILTVVLAACPLIACSYLLIPPINYILFQDHNIDDLLTAMITVITVVGVFFRSLIVNVNRHKFLRLFAACVELWNSATPADYIVISRWAGRVKFSSTAYFLCAQIAIQVFVLSAIFKQISLPDNSTRTYYPYGFEEVLRPSPQFEIRFGLQVVSGYFGMALISAVDVAGILVALTLCGQFDLIRSWLKNISAIESRSGNGEKDGRVMVELEKCIQRHQVVMNLYAVLEEAIQYVNLTQVLTSMYVFAIASAGLMKVNRSMKMYQNCGPFLITSIMLFLSCWPAETLISASVEVTRAVLELPWYRYSPQEKFAVAMMLARSQKPAQLTAGKFAMLSMKTFSTILYNGFSFCMVLSSF